MANVKNNDTIRELIQAANLQTGFDEIPSKIASSIVPVINVNPKNYRRINIVRGGTSSSSSSTANVYTTPSDKDFYLTSVHYFITKDAASDNVANTVLVSVDGTGDQTLISVPGITLTAMTYGTSLSFNSPIKLTRNTTIRMSSSFTAGVLIRGLNITGYTVDVV